jgi:protein-disulfide isomerase
LNRNLSKRGILRNKRLEQKRRKTKNFIIITLAVLALIAIIILLPNFIIGRSGSEDGRGFTLGDPNAPVSVVNFSNYACGFCADFSANVEPILINAYVETGEVLYRYVNLPHRDPDSLNAAKASYCAADQNQFFDYKSFLYSAAGTQGGFSNINLVNMAAAAGLDSTEFGACLEDNTHANAPNEDLRYAQSLGITGTPTFLINGQLVSSREVIPLIDSLLNR